MLWRWLPGASAERARHSPDDVHRLTTIPRLMNIAHFDSIDALPAAGKALLEAGTAGNPFLSPLWLTAFERRLVGPREQPHYVLAEAGGEPVLVLPLLLERRPLAGVVRARAMANFYTGVFEAVSAGVLRADPRMADAAAQAVAAALAGRFRRLALAELAPVRDVDGPAAAIMAALRGHGFAGRRLEAHGNWFEDCAGMDFAGYMAGRPGKVRSTLARKHRKLLREQPVEFVVATTPEAVAAAFPAYEAVYATSWKTPERSPTFIREVMTGLAGRGQARLGVLKVDGEPAAAQIWVKIADSWAVFKLAYDPRFTRYSVGTVLMAHLIECFFEAGPVDALDFLSGDDPYKQDWAGQRRSHWCYEAVSGHSAAGLALRCKRRLDGVRLN